MADFDLGSMFKAETKRESQPEPKAEEPKLPTKLGEVPTVAYSDEVVVGRGAGISTFAPVRVVKVPSGGTAFVSTSFCNDSAKEITVKIQSVYEELA